jgi:hypothetical protein
MTRKAPGKASTNDGFRYILLPVLLLTVTLAGGIRFSAESSELLFFPPPLVALILRPCNDPIRARRTY